MVDYHLACTCAALSFRVVCRQAVSSGIYVCTFDDGIHIILLLLLLLLIIIMIMIVVITILIITLMTTTMMITRILTMVIASWSDVCYHEQPYGI